MAVDVRAWAHRQDLQGDESIVGTAERFVARVRWLVRRTPATEGLSPRWNLTGDDGELYDIEAVSRSGRIRNPAPMVGRNVEARGMMGEAFKCWNCAGTWLYDPAREMPECPDGCGPKPKKKPGRKPKPKQIDAFVPRPKKPKPKPKRDFGPPTVTGYTLDDLLPESNGRDTAGDLTSAGAKHMRALIADGWTLKAVTIYCPPGAA